MDFRGKCSAEAAVLRAGYDCRYFNNRLVEKWADRWIAELDEPPTELLDLSILGDTNPVDVVKLLELIAFDQRLLIDAELGLVGVLYEQQRRSLRSLIGALFQLVWHDDLEEEIKSVIYYLEDGIDLAERGIHGTVEEIEKKFAELVLPYAQRIQIEFPELFALSRT